MFIPVILGTARKGRQSEKAAKYIVGQVQKAGLETDLIDVADYRTEATDRTYLSPQAKKWEEKLKKADALIIVSPEYNHSYSGELKMFLDLQFDLYTAKPVGFVGVSSGPLGGARGIQSLKLACLGMKMQPIYEAVYIPMVQDQFGPDGKPKSEFLDKSAAAMLEVLVKRAQAK